MQKTGIFMLTLFIISLSSAVFAQEAKKFTFVGSRKCKACHSKEEDGAAYKTWQENRHSKAFQTLAGDKAKAVAKKKGIEDPQKADECLQCHVTAHGVDASLLGLKFTHEEGVGCEACHGPGSVYKSKKVKKAIVAGETDPLSVGLMTPTEEDCRKCHNEKSPTFTGFDFEKTSKKIAHPKPKDVE